MAPLAITPSLHNTFCVFSLLFCIGLFLFWILPRAKRLISRRQSVSQGANNVIVLQSDQLLQLRSVLQMLHRLCNIHPKMIRHMLRRAMEDNVVKNVPLSSPDLHLLPDAFDWKVDQPAGQSQVRLAWNYLLADDVSHDGSIIIETYFNVPKSYLKRVSKLFQPKKKKKRKLSLRQRSISNRLKRLPSQSISRHHELGKPMYTTPESPAEEMHQIYVTSVEPLRPKEFDLETNFRLTTNEELTFDNIDLDVPADDSRIFCVLISRHDGSTLSITDDFKETEEIAGTGKSMSATELDHDSIDSRRYVEISIFDCQSRNPKLKLQALVDFQLQKFVKYVDVYGLNSWRQTLGVHETADCKICFVAPASVILLPCRHCCSCASCFAQLDKCPICRSKIRQSLRWSQDDEDVAEESVEVMQDKLNDDQELD